MHNVIEIWPFARHAASKSQGKVIADLLCLGGAIGIERDHPETLMDPFVQLSLDQINFSDGFCTHNNKVRPSLLTGKTAIRPVPLILQLVSGVLSSLSNKSVIADM